MDASDYATICCFFSVVVSWVLYSDLQYFCCYEARVNNDIFIIYMVVMSRVIVIS